jgi:uncharacterized glyoxalase superfamily protein PhnB
MTTTSQAGAARLRAVTPQFLVTDLERATAFYTEKLRFRVAFVYQDFYAGVERDGILIHLKRSDEPDPARAFRQAGGHLDVYIQTEGVDALYREFQGREGITFGRPVEETDWGTREFSVVDESGYILFFGEEVKPQQAR